MLCECVCLLYLCRHFADYAEVVECEEYDRRYVSCLVIAVGDIFVVQDLFF